MAYVLFVFLMVWFGYRSGWNRLLTHVTEKQAVWFTGFTFLLLLILFAAVYPWADSGIFGGGSDSDDDLNLSVRRLLAAQYPYHDRTYLGNLLTFFPGALLLAIPFVVLGTSAYQNVFWLPLFFAVAKSRLRSWRQALVLFWTLLVLSPALLQQFLTGYTGLANSIYILCFSYLVIRWVPQEGRVWRKMLACVLLGIALSSRMNYLLLLPLIFSTFVQNAGWKPAIKYILLISIAFAVITLPFYLYDPAGFSPLQAQWSRLFRFRRTLPYAHFLIPSMALIISLALSFKRMGSDGIALFRNCTFVQMFPVLSILLLLSLRAGHLHLRWAGYGVHFLFFGALSFWVDLVKRQEDNPASAR